MNIRETLATIHQMKVDGVIESYAIGGAVGASFYLEPTATLDVDIFVGFQGIKDQLVLDLRPIYDHLKSRGGVADGEHIVVGGWPVQILAPGNPLVEEALDCAIEHDAGGVPMRVFSAEHLAAIALQTGRAKDKARLLQFIESGVLDLARFQAILLKHGLNGAWEKFKQRFLSDQP